MILEKFHAEELIKKSGINVYDGSNSPSSEFASCFYVGLSLDYRYSKISFVVSTEVGNSIKKIVKDHSSKIIKTTIDPAVGYKPYISRKLAHFMGLKGGNYNKIAELLKNLFDLYIEYDCALVEINRLILTKTGELLADDIKVDIDDNALVRHQDILSKTGNINSVDYFDVAKSGYTYTNFDGDVTCIVNGSGLAMATMDIIKLKGGGLANFLDINGGATLEVVKEAVEKILDTNRKLKVILVNVFGGITKCDTIADSMVAVNNKRGLNVPVIVRLEGTNVASAKKIFKESNLQTIFVTDLNDAAAKVVNILNGKEE